RAKAGRRHALNCRRFPMSVPLSPSDLSDDQELLDLPLSEEGVPPSPPLVPSAPGTPLVLSPAQQRLWFLQQLDPESTAYAITGAVRLAGRLDRAALIAALRDLVARHEILRWTFPAEEGRAAPRLQAEVTVTPE